MDTSRGIEKLSNLKKSNIANITGIVIANPPKEGVMPSCIAFSLLSYSFPSLLTPGLYVISYLLAIYPTIGVKIKEDIAPIAKRGRYFKYLAKASLTEDKSI